MGIKGGSSWFAVVRRVFRSPTKDYHNKSSRRRDHDFDELEEEQKKREKRRWFFQKSTTITATSSFRAEKLEADEVTSDSSSRKMVRGGVVVVNPVVSAADQRHAMTVAAAAAEAAVATAKAAVEIIQLTTTTSTISGRRSLSNSVREHYAAVLIQAAFRGYMARTALRGLKAIVKLQAIVRGHIVRKQAMMTLKCAQALRRLQARMRNQQARRLSLQTSTSTSRRKSMFAETSHHDLWDSTNLRDIRQRKSLSGDGACIANHWKDQHPSTLVVDVEAIQQKRKEAGSEIEKPLPCAFSQQIRRSEGGCWSSEEEKELEERLNWLERWMAEKHWENSSATLRDTKEAVKMVDIDYSSSRHHGNSTTPNARKSQSPRHNYQTTPQYPIGSPSHRASYHHLSHSSPRPKPLLQVRPKSPGTSSSRHFVKEGRKSYSTANTPCLAATGLYHSSYNSNNNTGARTALPNYMAATESAKARARPQSAPRQRPSTADTERHASARKCLSYPALEPYNNHPHTGCNSTRQNLRSHSFKSNQVGSYVGSEPQSNHSSCFMDTIDTEIHPCSTPDLRRWLR